MRENYQCPKLSRMVGISAPATLERVKRLETTGVISHFMAVVDPEKVGFPNSGHCQYYAELEQAIFGVFNKGKFSELEEVVECYQIAGAHDFILKVIAKDINAYAEFMNHKLTRIQASRASSHHLSSTASRIKKHFLS